MADKQNRPNCICWPASRFAWSSLIYGFLILSVVGFVHGNEEWFGLMLQPRVTFAYRDGSSPSYCIKSDYFAAKERVVARKRQRLQDDVQEPCYSR